MKLIFLDIDGTLTVPGENTPPESAVEAINKTRFKGNKVFLCTGRNPDMLCPLLKYDFDGYIACAGGYVKVGEELLFDCPMTSEQLDTALDTLHRNGVFCTIEGERGSWGDDNLKDFLKTQNEGNSEIERWRKALSSNLGIRPMGEYDNSPIYKVVIMCTDRNMLDEAKAALGSEFNFVVQDVKEHNCINGELVNKKFDKGKGVELIRNKLGISKADTIGFGDSMNDLEMIETVGFGVCMENGAEALKQRADMVCPAVSEDGLKKAFIELGLL